METIFYISFGVAVGIISYIGILKYITTRNLKKRMKKAKKGEIEAIDLMKNHGYKIVGLQKESTYTLLIKDRPHKVKVRADMIVKKGNKTYVAEVKTGEKATSPKYADTRRQLLEYFLVYKPYGLILVDMEKKKIKTVKYSILENKNALYLEKIMWLSFLFIVGFIIGFLTRGG